MSDAGPASLYEPWGRVDCARQRPHRAVGTAVDRAEREPGGSQDGQTCMQLYAGLLCEARGRLGPTYTISTGYKPGRRLGVFGFAGGVSAILVYRVR
jgi:hypothetical protein